MLVTDACPSPARSFSALAGGWRGQASRRRRPLGSGPGPGLPASVPRPTPHKAVSVLSLLPYLRGGMDTSEAQGLAAFAFRSLSLPASIFSVCKMRPIPLGAEGRGSLTAELGREQ